MWGWVEKKPYQITGNQKNHVDAQERERVLNGPCDGCFRWSLT